MDGCCLAASFVSHGAPPWRELVKTTGIIGTPLLEINTRFMKPATYGESIEIHTEITEWRPKVFIMRSISSCVARRYFAEGTEIARFAFATATNQGDRGSGGYQGALLLASDQTGHQSRAGRSSHS